MKLADFELERYFARYEFNAPYLLCCSDCETITIQDILQLEGEASVTDFMNLALGYTEAPGSKGLRGQIAGLYKNMGEENILVTSGAEEAIFIFMNAVLQAGDHVIVQYPCYQSLAEIAAAIGCEVSRWEMKEADHWESDFGFLRQKIRTNTRAIIVNMPHNPTGYLMPHKEWINLVDLLRENNILLFSDEVYRFLEYDKNDCLEAACDIYENAVSLGVMSKAYGLAGLRIGWVATGNHKILARMAAFKDYTTICNSAPSEFLAAIALKHHDILVQRNLDIIKQNLALLDEFFKRQAHLFSWVRPKAGPIAFPSLSGKGGADKFCSDLVTNRGVLLLPASCYGFGDQNFRIGFGRQSLPQALERLDNYLQDTGGRF
ncbi:MAG: aminotransferase class I/II-fold pyridoxal phosphate-dependent enzyme [Syntrophomonadaceae bacterium]|nr:aminotransferase class I/II-fold pyridoxal phosphate-dependent enzyme [Syntrophomonadaceae bacterium]